MDFSAQMAKELGLGSSDELKKHADALWKYLDDLASRDPEAYRRFVAKQAEEAKQAEQQQRQELSFIPQAGFVVSTVAIKGNADLIAQIERAREAKLKASKSPLDLGIEVDSTAEQTGQPQAEKRKPAAPVVIQDNAMVFVNICHSNSVAAPLKEDHTPAPSSHPLGKTIVPLSVGALRMDDVSAAQYASVSTALVCDVAFSTSALERAMGGDLQFKLYLIDLALQHAEKDFRCKLHRSYKMVPLDSKTHTRYLGKPLPQYTEQGLKRRREAREKMQKLQRGFTKDDVVLPSSLGDRSLDDNESKASLLGGDSADDAGSLSSVRLPGESRTKQPLIQELSSTETTDSQPVKRITPKFSIKTIAGEVEVAVDLPLVNSATGLEVDLSSMQLSLQSSVYSLVVPLPCPVDDSRSSAKFNKKKKRLTISAPIT